MVLGEVMGFKLIKVVSFLGLHISSRQNLSLFAE